MIVCITVELPDDTIVHDLAKHLRYAAMLSASAIKSRESMILVDEEIDISTPDEVPSAKYSINRSE